jgi:hypothetical protein
MIPRGQEIEHLRARLTTTIQHGTKLIADLKALDEGFQMLMPSLAELTAAERETGIARLCGFDEALPERLETLVESLADVLAGLTTSDGGQAWLRHQLSRLDTGEDLATG